MKVNYCDLCNAPLKEGNYYMIYLTEPEQKNIKNMGEYYDYLDKIEKEVKEICPSCKHVFDRMFELRLQKLSELANEILNIYNLQSKLNPKERKNGKDKK
jgi:hypothetical protein